MTHPSRDPESQPRQPRPGSKPAADRIWADPPRPTGPADPRHHDLVNDLDYALDLPVPFALAGPLELRGVQPRVEFTADPVLPVNRFRLSDAYLAHIVHMFAVIENEPCGCGGPSVPGGCACSTCRPRNEGGPR